ncbi:MAG: hypothetical protein JWO51_4948 [Rhodospirillales bacterium]|nr:hypothetical protein [Rhodospirillales bacterium]
MANGDYQIPTYPTVKFLVAHGMPLAILIGLAPLVIAVVLVVLGWSAWVIAAGVGISLVLGVVLVSYVEVLRVISDTLMPK